MDTSAKAIACMVLVGSLWGWSRSSSPSSTRPSVSEVAVHYTNYQQITKSEVYVNPELAMLCRGASKEEVEAARIKFGPHANTGILIYMDNVAADAFTRKAKAYPVGSVIVKKKTIHGYTDNDGKRVLEADTGVGGMVKRSAGYDPTHGDWEYFYFEDTRKIESGRISSCVQCHASAKDKDYVFGTWRTAGG
jgi:hypothetical protein